MCVATEPAGLDFGLLEVIVLNPSLILSIDFFFPMAKYEKAMALFLICFFSRVFGLLVVSRL